MLGAVFAAVVALSGSAASAEEFGDAQSCLDARIEANEPVAECVNEVQAICMSFDAPSFAGADCYRRAKDHWGGLISARMERIEGMASEELAAIAGIELTEPATIKAMAAPALIPCSIRPATSGGAA